ncbi:MAG: YncE family protein [Chloroflexi bacterium]|nr:YncE family protein [Chloroflexota bacterium]
MNTQNLIQHGSRVLHLLVIVGLLTGLALVAAPPQRTVAAATRKMVWVNRGNSTIYRADLDGTNVQPITPGAGTFNLHGVALDRVAGKMYYTSNSDSTIYQADLDGTDAVPVTPASLIGPMGIALDPAGGKMYYVSYNSGSVMRADLNGDNPETLATIAVGLVGIALDEGPVNAYVTNYWSGIYKVHLATRAVTNIISSPVTASGAQMIEVDSAGGKMYWANSYNNTIYRADLNGDNAQLLVSGSDVNVPVGIALDVSAGKVYWTNQGNSTIYCANLDGTGVGAVTLPAGVVNDPYDIALGFDVPSAIQLQSFSAMAKTPLNVLAIVGVMGLALMALVVRVAARRRRCMQGLAGSMTPLVHHPGRRPPALVPGGCGGRGPVGHVGPGPGLEPTPGLAGCAIAARIRDSLGQARGLASGISGWH